MLKRDIRLGILIITLASLVSCGAKVPSLGRGNNSPAPVVNVVSSNPSNNPISAQIVGAPINGIKFIGNYGSSGVTGFSNNLNGTFVCKSGETIKFYLTNNIYIGKSGCNEKIFLEQLGNTSDNTPYLLTGLLLNLNTNTNNSNFISMPLFNPNLVVTDLQDILDGNPPDSNGSYVESDISTSINDIFNSIINRVTNFNASDLASMNLAGKNHYVNYVNSNSDVKSSDRNISGTFTNWLNTRATSSSRVLNLDSSSVIQTVASGTSPSRCPAYDLNGIGISITHDDVVISGSNVRRYFLSSVKINTSNYLNSTVYSKTRILTKKAVNVFNIVLGTTVLSGSVSLGVLSDLSGATGLVKFDIFDLNNQNDVRATCEYSVSL